MSILDDSILKHKEDLETLIGLVTNGGKSTMAYQALKRYLRGNRDLHNIINGIGKDGRTPLTCAIRKSADGMSCAEIVVELLIKYDADVNKCDRIHTPLIHMIYGYGKIHHNKSMIELLLQKGADINLASPDGHTAFSILMSHHSPKDVEDFIDIFIQAGANVNAHRSDYSTPLLRAVNFSPSWRKTRIVDRLLQAGANPNDPPDILILAATKSVKSVKHLLLAGADPWLYINHPQPRHTTVSEEITMSQQVIFNYAKYLVIEKYSAKRGVPRDILLMIRKYILKNEENKNE